MANGLLSLKWNNHHSTFFHHLTNIRNKESYCDVTIACEGKFYPVHKLVLSIFSTFFEELLERTDCKHPFVVLKDIQSQDLEALLNYMYVGEVKVCEDKVDDLIRAAECLMVKDFLQLEETSFGEGKGKKQARVSTEHRPLPRKRKIEEVIRPSTSLTHQAESKDTTLNSLSQQHTNSKNVASFLEADVVAPEHASSSYPMIERSSECNLTCKMEEHLDLALEAEDETPCQFNRSEVTCKTVNEGELQEDFSQFCESTQKMKMPHISILPESQNIQEAFTIEACQSCELGCKGDHKSFHCPICPVNKFRPNRRKRVLRHLHSHFYGPTGNLQFHGYRITACPKNCVKTSNCRSHFHCPVCDRTFSKKAYLVQHAGVCTPLLADSSNDPSLSDPEDDKWDPSTDDRDKHFDHNYI